MPSDRGPVDHESADHCGAEKDAAGPGTGGARPVCVTGGAGFLGRALVRRLLDRGDDVVVIDDMSGMNAGRGVFEILEAAGGRLRLVQASVLEPRALAEAVEGVGVVYHLAAVASVAAAQEDPVRSYEVNAVGAARVAQAAREAGAERVVYTATSAVYGENDPPHAETMRVEPKAVYAASKLAGEHAIAAWARSMGVDGVSLRLFNLVGPGQCPDSEDAAVVPAFVEALAAGRAPSVHGDGSQTRDFLHIQDAVDAILLAGRRLEPFMGGVINVGSGKAVTVLEVLAELQSITGVSIPPEHLPRRSGDVPRSCADTAKAARVLRFRAQRTLRDALEGAAAGGVQLAAGR